MENLPFDLPHTIYINNLRNMKGLGGLDNIYYVALIKKVLWDQEVYHVFDKTRCFIKDVSCSRNKKMKK